jgi:thiamine pyrophosphokinase
MADMVLIVANGNWPRSELIETLLEASDFTIALDGAADRFDSWDVVVGDLDSILKPEHSDADLNQDNTDLAKALMMYEVDAVVGISGGRLDHQIAAFTALFETKSDAILYFDNWRACRVGESGLEIELEKGSICSIMAFGKVSEVILSGVEFELNGEDISTGTRGVGNRVTEGEVKISHNAGDLLFIWEGNAP